MKKIFKVLTAVALFAIYCGVIHLINVHCANASIDDIFYNVLFTLMYVGSIEYVKLGKDLKNDPKD